MSIPTARLAAPLLLALAAGPLGADTIYRTDGPPIEKCTVIEENISSVIYTEEGKSREQAVASDAVLDVVFTSKPPRVEEADLEYEGGKLALAAELFGVYLEERLGGSAERKKWQWAPAYAARQILALRTAMGQADEAIAAADVLIRNFPESRYVPDAYLTKSEVLLLTGRRPEARVALEEFKQLVDERGLSSRYRLEAKLGLLETDDALRGAERRNAFDEISKDAGDEFPTVRNRALVALGQAMLQESDFEGATEAFAGVAADPKADDATLAGAYSGLGDCLYQQGISKGDKDVLGEAVKNYMRVVVVYRDQTRYSARAMYFAARALDNREQEGDREKAARLYRTVQRQFPGSKWAEEARNYSR
jgi:tetratricopeptide (TPR) repeat protein